jgi:hypothetical protein
MLIRKPKLSEIKKIKSLVDSSEERDVINYTFSEKYYKRILQKGILLIAFL